MQRMPPLYRPTLPPGKRPPHVLPVDLSAFVNLGDGTGWPLTLAFPTDGGMWLPCGMFHPLVCDNDDQFSESRVGEL